MTKLYDAYHTSRGGSAFESANDDVLKLLVKFYSPAENPSVLDGGVGQCHMVRGLAQQGYTHVRGHEISAFAIEKFCDGLSVSHGLLKKTPYEDAEFDAVTSIDVIEHIPPEDVPETLSEIQRILKPGGLLIFKVGPCAKNCGGFCALRAVPPSGICARLPYSWWHDQALTAGLSTIPEGRLEEYEKHLHIHGMGCCQAGAAKNTITGDACDLKTNGGDNKVALPCSVSQKGYNYFFYSKP